MSTLEYTIYGIKRGWRFSRTFVFTGAFAAAVVGGVFANAGMDGFHRVACVALFGLWAIIFGFRAHARFTSQKANQIITGRADLEMGLMLVLATHAGVQMAGGLASPFYPAVFVLVAFLVVYTRQWVGFTLVAATIGIEFALISVDPSNGAFSQAMLHAIFIALFSLINLVFTRTEVTRMRLRTVKKIEQAKLEMADDARAFRLTSASSGGVSGVSRKDEEERLSRCTVSEVRRSMYHHIDLLKRTMGLNTCILFWLNDKRNTLRIFECVTEEDEISMRDFGAKEGIVGGILQSGSPMILKDLRPGYPGITYYSHETSVTDFLGVPIKDGAVVRGVLCADRKGNMKFTESEKDVFCSAVDSIVQNVSNERVFIQLQKAKSEQGKLLRASESLSQALTEKDVVEAALEAASQIAQFDLAAVGLVDEKGKQVIKQVRGESGELLEGLILGANSGLAGSVLKTKHFLPYRGNFDAKQQVVYTKKVQKVFEPMQSLLVLPLIAGDEVLGTLTVASATKNAYTEDIRTTLQVMINQLGTTLQNAAMVRKLEEMATTDGLTGLPNHRSFQEELTRQLAQSNRFGSQTSIILCDVDKFKGVNDTYGHPVGDMVLKALGETLRRNVVRDTDMPARYGGEEFVIVCGGTDTQGAVQLGERIREDLENQVFKTEKGDLRCTISMGVSSFPTHARSKEDLIERADLALYAAKEGGRNQVRVWKKGLQK